MAELNTLPEDIYNLFDPDKDHELSEENLDELCNNLKEVLRTRLSKQKERNKDEALRFSNLGRGDRYLWNLSKGIEQEPLPHKAYFKFLYGDLIELIILFLAKESGHSVENQQGEVESRGIKGHIDAIIDGTVVDVKSASPFGYQKLKQLKVLDDDPFGYVAQLSGYANELTPGKSAAWVAVDKVSGDICVPELSSGIVEGHKPEDRIEHLEKVIASEVPPEKCYEDIPEGKSGNRRLATGCSYCPFRKSCWPEVRTFLYSTGPKFLTVVKEQPRVTELIAGEAEAPEITD